MAFGAEVGDESSPNGFKKSKWFPLRPNGEPAHMMSGVWEVWSFICVMLVLQLYVWVISMHNCQVAVCPRKPHSQHSLNHSVKKRTKIISEVELIRVTFATMWLY